MQSISEEEERDGRTSPLVTANSDLLRDTGAPLATTGTEEHDTPPPTLKCHKWLEEIETDVLRTCPGDDTAGEDAIDEFNAAISRQSSTAAGQDGGSGTGDDTLSSTRSGGSTRVRFSFTDSSFGSSSGAVVGGNEDGANEKRRLSTTGGGTRDKLRRVLRAFAVYNRRVSYCQVCTVQCLLVFWRSCVEVASMLLILTL